MQVLTDKEMQAVIDAAPEGLARAIEAAVLAKLSSADPVAWVGRIEDGAMLLMDEPTDWVATPLYEHPPAPVSAEPVAWQNKYLPNSFYTHDNLDPQWCLDDMRPLYEHPPAPSAEGMK